MDSPPILRHTRARRACGRCHQRKVRCIRLLGLESCVHCIKDNLQCLEYPTKRRALNFTANGGQDNSRPFKTLPRYGLERRLSSLRELEFGAVGWRSTPNEVIMQWYRSQSLEPAHQKLDTNASDFPSISFVDAVVVAFLKWHSFINPILNGVEIAALLREPRTDLLLLNAIMFVGCDYVEHSHLRKEGYDNRVQARTMFFSRALVSTRSLSAALF